MQSSVLWTADELATLCKAQWRGVGVDVSGIAYLPDRVQPGDLFVAMVYDGVDHHQSIGKALAAGARAAMVSRIPDDLPEGMPLLVSKGMRHSLVRLGEAGRQRTQAQFIGVTARAGKTFIKDTLTQLLRAQAITGHTQSNDNDTTGVAITLARFRPETAYGVIEISRAMTGDVAASVRVKSQMVRPQVAIIGQIGSGEVGLYRTHHVEIATDKAGIMEGLQPGGTIILNRDDTHVFDLLYSRAKALGVAHIHSYGAHEQADIRLLRAERCAAGFEVTLALHGEVQDCIIGVNGRHLVENAMAVIGGIAALGADVKQALRDLADVRESPGRGNRYHVPLAGGEALLLDYTRNATMLALNASLQTLGEMQPSGHGRRVLALSELTDMPDNHDDFYRDIVKAVERYGIERVLVAGEAIVSGFYQHLPAHKQAGWAATSQQLAPMVQAELRPGDVILTQGWRKMKMNRVVKALVGERYLPW